MTSSDVSLTTSQNQVDFFCRRERCATYVIGDRFSGFSSFFAGEGRSLTSATNKGDVAFWVEHGNVNGFNFSKDEDSTKGAGVILSEEFTLRRGSLSCGFQQKLVWITPSGSPLIHETRTVKLTPAPCQGYAIDISLDFQSLEKQAVFFGKNENSFLRLSLASSLRLAGGGQLRNSLASYRPEEFEGQSARWFSAIGVVGGETVGLAFLDHPGNPWFPTPWNLSSEGVISPTPFAWRDHSLEPDETLALKFRLLVHRGYVDAGWATDRLNEWVF